MLFLNIEYNTVIKINVMLAML